MTTLTEQLKHGADQAWKSLSEGWRELSAHANGALTRFWPIPTTTASKAVTTAPAAPQESLRLIASWAFIAADVFDDAEKVIVRLEVPGMRRDDFNVELNGDVLTVSGKKHIENEVTAGRWRSVQCAYGSFRRDVALPVSVRADKTKAIYRDGVLRIELPKLEEARTRRVAVQVA